MKSRISRLAGLSLILLACSLFSLKQDIPEMVASVGPRITELLGDPTASRTGAPQPSEGSPASTDTPRPLTPRQQRDLRASLQDILASDMAAGLNLSERRRAEWQAFIAGQAELSEEEAQLAQSFVTQWERLLALSALAMHPAEAVLGMRVVEPDGGTSLILYPVDEQASAESGSLRLFLTIRNAKGEELGLILAPELGGFRQQPSQDGRFVEYADEKGKTRLLAEARSLGDRPVSESKLKEVLDNLYGGGIYVEASAYPRYQYPIAGVDAGFYALDEVLSYTQVVLLRETLELFTRPNLSPLAPHFFPAENAYVFYESIAQAAGLTYTGTGVVTIDRRDLFGNKYYLASVLSHEASHVLQGGLPQNFTCGEVLRREIGDHTIPADFYSWDAARLVAAIQDISIGAYHVSLWILSELNLRDTAWLVETIRTGMVNGHSVVNCKQ